MTPYIVAPRWFHVFFSFFLSFFVACGTATDDDMSDDDTADDDASADDDTPPEGVTVHIEAPWDWETTFHLNSVEMCPIGTSCDIDIDDPGEYIVGLRRANTLCVGQHINVNQAFQSGQTINLVDAWEEPGICGLNPAGYYQDGLWGEVQVNTYVNDKVHVQFFNGEGIVTNDTFASVDSNHVFHGTIAEDLSWIEYEFEDDNGVVWEGTMMKQ